MPPLKIVLAQLNPCAGDISGNVTRANDIIASNAAADLIVFAEGYISGYPVEDLVLRPGFIAAVEDGLRRVVDCVVENRGPAVIIGAPIAGPGLPYNAAIFIKPDGTKTIATKVDRPNEGVFDEVRQFAPGALRPPVLWKGVRIGVGICEEMWHSQVAAHLAGELADLMIFINGSPYQRGKQETLRMAHAARRVRETGVPLIYHNLVGGQDSLIFDGASFALDADGSLSLRMAAFAEDVIQVTFPFKTHHIKPYPVEVAADYMAAVIALRDYVNKSGFDKVVIGMSGGIDSALAGAIAIDALGPQRVTAITMPSSVTSIANFADALEVCKRLEIACETVAIGDSELAVQKALEGLALDWSDDGITRQNLSARLRMVMLMAISNSRGHMLVTTGNKSELSVGYATLYGDMAGGFNVLKDFYKTEVWTLARYRNAHCPIGALGAPGVIIPESVIAKPPSAELASGQTDEARLGPYVILDALLRALIDDSLEIAPALHRVTLELKSQLSLATASQYLTIEHAGFIARLIGKAEYKRRQSAPGPKIGPRAFGSDRRYPIVNGFPFTQHS